MKYLLAPLLALSLVGCSLLDGPVVSEVEPSATPSPIARSADLLVFGGFSQRFVGMSDPLVKIMYEGYELALDEVGGEVAGLKVELIRRRTAAPTDDTPDPEAIPNDITDRLGGADNGGLSSRMLADAVIEYTKREPRLIATMGPNHWLARDDGSIEALCRAGITMFGPVLPDPATTATGCPSQYFFRTVGSAGSSGRVAARYFAEEGVKRVLVLTARTDNTRLLPIWSAQLSAFTAEAKKSGVQLVAERDLASTDAATIRSFKPDAVLLLGRADEAATVALWKLRSAIATVPFMITDLGISDSFLSAGREYSAPGPVLVASFSFEPSAYLGYQDFLRRWESRFGEEIGVFDAGLAMDSYAAMKALLTAIEQIVSAGISDPREIAARLPGALASLKLDGAPYGEPWGFTGSGDRYPVIGGIYTIDPALSEEYSFPLRAVRYE